MPEKTETLPNYSSHGQSPVVDNVGVQIRLAKGHHRVGEPLVLRGAYRIGAELIHRSKGIPLAQVMLIVFRRDKLDAWLSPAQDASNISPVPSQPASTIDPSYREGGYFNLDLNEMCNILAKGGRYWIMAAMGDYVSGRLEFEIAED
ncbi:MAG: hypothetical protein HQ546_06800 [Planctomycetes bacterium]|nr:hypothetical protein [Planctomycetota bacterium]